MLRGMRPSLIGPCKKNRLGIGSSDPYYNNVVFYLKGDGINGSTDIVDEKANRTILKFGNVQISTAQKKYGTGSIYFDGLGSYLNARINSEFLIGSEDFTVECWFQSHRVDTYSNTGRIVGTYNYSTTDRGWFFGVNRTSPAFSFSAGRESPLVTAAVPGYLAQGQWYHLAACYQGSTLRLFVNGVLSATATMLNSDTFLSDLIIGSGNDRSLVSPVGGGIDLKGWIDSLRITKKVARYTTNFNPETDTYLAY